MVTLVLVEPNIAFGDTSVTFNSSNSDGYLAANDLTYSVARTQATSDVHDQAGSTFTVGQDLTGALYFLFRGCAFFDTASIPNFATITSATLSLYVSTDESDDDFNVTVQVGGGFPSYPHDPFLSGDYYHAYYSGDGGSRNTNSISGSGYWNITLNSDGYDMISKTGITKLFLRSSKDIDNTAPTQDEYVVFSSSDAGYAPILYVDYAVAGEDYYSYTLHGPFDEETGVALNENVTVGVWSSEGGPYESFTLNGSYIYNVSTLVQFFQFTFDDNSTREYWVDPSESATATIYVFWGNTTSYAIAFLDTTGILGSYPYVTARRYINGSLYIVEKRQVDAYNTIIMNLVAGRTYTIYLGNEEDTYIFGDLVVASSTSIQLTLRGVDFPKETLLTQKYVYCYAYRNSSIFVVYNDTSENTASVFVEILYSDFSTAYNTTQYSNSFTLEWTSAVANVTYVARVTANHNTYGTITYKQTLLGDTSLSTAPFDLGFLGDWGFDSSSLIPSLIILCVAGCFSALNAEVGAVLMCITAIILTLLGWISISMGLLVSAFTLAIVMALVYHKRRGGIGH